MNRYSHLGEAIATHHSSSLNASTQYTSSGTHQTDHASVAPSSASVGNSTVQARHMSVELPAMPNTDPASPVPQSAATASTIRGYIPSGVSNISERDRVHLRTISDTTVSSVASAPRNAETEAVAEEPTPQVDTLVSPEAVSPPTATATSQGPASDYVTAQPLAPVRNGSNVSPTSPLRRSVFHESREDMTDSTDPKAPMPK